MAGLFITVEGIDGAGKSTHLPALASWLAARGQEVVTTREPGGTALAETLRELMLGREMDGLTEALLMFAARRDHLGQVIEPALARGASVLCDRFTDATLAYQGGGRGYDWGRLLTLESWVQAGRQPDLTIWFDLPAATAAARRAAARVPDRFETQDEAFFERVRQGYRRRQQADAQRFLVIDASLAPHQVEAQLRAGLEARLP